MDVFGTLNYMVKWCEENYQILSVVGAIWVFYKWHVSQMQRDAELLERLVDKIRIGEVRKFIDMCDYETPWYGPEVHKAHGDNNSFKVDHALTTLSGLCYMRESGLISRKAFAFFEYDFELLFSDPQVIDYMYNLYHNSKKEHMSFPFKCLLRYGYKRKLISVQKSVFEDPAAHLYVKTLHQYLDFE